MTYSIIVNLGTLIAVGGFVWYIVRQHQAAAAHTTAPPAEADSDHDAPES